MRKHIFYYFLANMFIYASIYSAHDFLRGIIKKETQLSLSQSSLLDLFEIVRIPGACLFAFLADKTRRPVPIVILCVFGYCMSVAYFVYAPDAIKPRGFTLLTFVVDASIRFFNCGIFPPLEILVLRESLRTGSHSRTYGVMRVSATLGRIAASLSNMVFCGNKDTEHRNMVNLLVVFGAAAIIVLGVSTFLPDESIEKRVGESVGFAKNMSVILRSGYGMILLVVILQGIPRTSYSSTQSQYLASVGVTNRHQLLIFLMRVVPESIFYLTAPHFEKVVGCYWLFSVATVSCLLHMAPYLCLPEQMAKGTQVLFYASVEVFKGMTSCLMGYSCAKITRMHVPEHALVTAQGLYNASLIGFGGALSGTIGYFVLGSGRGASPREFMPFFTLNFVVGLCGTLLIITLAILRTKKSTATLM